MDAAEFVQLMKKLLEGHEQLKSLGQQKQEVLVRGDVAALDRLVQQETSSLYRNGQLDQKREKWIDDWTRRLGLEEGQNIRLQQMIDWVDDVEQKQQLQEISRQLPQVIRELQAVNESNRGLIEQSLAFVEQNLSLLFMHEEQNTYDQSGDTERGQQHQQRSWLDRKV